MIICVIECIRKKNKSWVENHPIFIDTTLATTEIQKQYVSKIADENSPPVRNIVEAECSYILESENEITRLVVQLPQRVEKLVYLQVNESQDD